MSSKEECLALRQHMIETTLLTRNIRDPRVLQAMLDIPRHAFVPNASPEQAYGDHPLAIGQQQTISQPFIVAYMAEAAQLPDNDAKVLEIGTGSGYGAAVLSAIADEVYTIEVREELSRQATNRFTELGLTNIHTKIGDGAFGWTEHAPFDAIVVTAAPPRTPTELLGQLKVGGRMVIPVGKQQQHMLIITRTDDGYEHQLAFPVRFVPMIGDILKEHPQHPPFQWEV